MRQRGLGGFRRLRRQARLVRFREDGVDVFLRSRRWLSLRCGRAPRCGRTPGRALAGRDFARSRRIAPHQRSDRGAARLEAGNEHALDFLADQVLDRRQRLEVFRRHERDRLARQARSAGAADPVHVVLGRARDVEVDHLRQAFDIEAARRDVGRHQHRGLARLERLQRQLALALRLVAVDRIGVDVVPAQLMRQAVGADARAAEDQHLLQAASLDEVREQLALLLPRHGVQHVADQLGGGVAGRDLDLRRVLQDGCRKPADLVRKSGRPHQVLPHRRQQRDDALDVGHEPHVEHAVGFVQDQHAHVVEHHRFVLHVIEQPAGRRDQDLDAPAQLVDLRIHVHASVHQGAPQRHVPAVVAEALVHLDCQLARRREHERAHRMARRRRRTAGVRCKALQRRQGERGGLAGAGLRACHEVAPREHERNGLLLYRSRLLVSEFAHHLKKRGRQTEGVEA